MRLNEFFKEHAYHIAYGRHSGIPGCCIHFFLHKWGNELSGQTAYAKLINDLSWGYVPCPECIAKGNKVHVIDCAKEHRRECREDFKYPLTERQNGGIL